MRVQLTAAGSNRRVKRATPLVGAAPESVAIGLACLAPSSWPRCFQTGRLRWARVLHSPPACRSCRVMSRLRSIRSPSTPRRRLGLPHAAESHGDRLAVHAPGGVAAQERDHLGYLRRLQDALLRVDGGALEPHPLDADAAPFCVR